VTCPTLRAEASGPLSVEAGYDAWAAFYDRDDNPIRDLDARVLRAQPFVPEARRVIEIGCGTGKNTGFFARFAQHVIGIDFSKQMLARARAHPIPANVRLVRHDLRERWPVDDTDADLVSIDLVLEHVAELGHVFAEAFRALQAGGVLFVCELHPYRQLLGKQARFVDPSSGAKHELPVVRHTTAEYVNGGLAAGFALERLGEWYRDDDPDLPALLSLVCRKPA
jgi:ubiquinone/menaquinone biosynthesis C-methylase UbiE